MSSSTPTTSSAADSADLATADALATEGRFLDAIDVLTAVNRIERSDAVEQRLAALRNEAFAEVAGTQPGWPWEDEPPRPRPEIAGLPSIGRGELNAETLRDNILTYGCAYVRELLTPDQCAELRRVIDNAFDAYDMYRAGTTKSEVPPAWRSFPEHDTAEMAGTRHWVREGGGVLTGDSPRALFTFLETMDEVGIRDLVAAYLGERPVLSLGKSTLRRVSPTGPGDWHQDGAFLGTDLRVINVWVTLSDCGVTSPGLEVVPRRLPGLAPSGTHGTWFDWGVAPDMALEAAGDVATVAPHYRAGDALLFDELFLHRTDVTPDMNGDRYAIETWMFAPSLYPGDQTPIVW